MSLFDSLVQTALQSTLGGNAENQTNNLVKGVVGRKQTGQPRPGRRRIRTGKSGRTG